MRILLLLVVFAAGSCASKNAEGRGIGFGGEMIVEVELDNGSIKDITVLRQNETDILFDRALPILRDRIVSADSPMVDNVSGA